MKLSWEAKRYNPCILIKYIDDHFIIINQFYIAHAPIPSIGNIGDREC